MCTEVGGKKGLERNNARVPRELWHNGGNQDLNFNPEFTVFQLKER